MKRLSALLLAVIFLTGCFGEGDELERAIALRELLLHADGYAFDSIITADYGEKIYTFGMHCQFDNTGALEFEVYDPETISGIKGTICDSIGKLTFEDTVLAFELLADGQISPISSPWIMIKTLRSGYLNACGLDNGILKMEIDDSYAEDALHLDIWTDEKDIPARAEIIWQGRRILTIDIRNFRFL